MTKKIFSNKEQETPVSVDKAILRKVAWRSLTSTGELNKETMQGSGFGYALLPVLRKLYFEQDDLKAAIIRHIAYFNTYPASIGYILGCTSQLEEASIKNPQGISSQTVDSTKLSMMGPLAGLGDNLMMNGLRIILTIVGIDFALSGNPVAPLLFFLVFNSINLYLRLKGVFVGYDQGPTFMQRLQEEKVTERLAVWINGVKAALIGYLLYRGISSLQVPQLTFLDDSLGQIIPKWSILLLLSAGVIMYKKRNGRLVYIVLLAIISAGITYLILQQ